MEMKSLKQRSVPRRVAGFLCACVVALALFLRTLVITWFLRPVRNWWSPSPFTAPVTPAEFFALLQSGDTERVKSVLRAGRDPNALVPDPSAAPSRGKNRKLPLSVAVGLANRDLVEVLVRHGANPFKCVFKQKTPLDLAMELDKVPLVESMLRLCIGTKSPRAVLRKKVKVTLRNALCQAVRKNNASLCRLMLQYGADPFADRCTSHWEVLVDCWRHRDHSRGAASDWGATEPNAFRAAVRQGNIAIVRSILQHSLDSEHTPTQSVHRTVHQSIIDIVDIVDKHPARTRQLLGVLREILRLWDALAVAMETTLQETERPALIHAVMVCSTNDPRRLGCVHALLTGGMSVNVQDSEGGTALFHAVLQRKTAAAELLLKHGADPDLRPGACLDGYQGVTPLITAVRYPASYTDATGTPRQDVSLVALLVETGGASVDAADASGTTVLSHAVQRAAGRSDVLRFLLRHNASLHQPVLHPHPLIDRFVHQRLIEFGLDVAEFCIDVYYDFTVGGTRFVLNSGRHFRQAIIRQIPLNFMYMGCWISDEFVRFFRGKDVMARALEDHGLDQRGIRMLIDAGCDTASLSKLNRYPRLHPLVHADPEFRELIRGAISTPPSLQQACRLVLRRRLRSGPRFIRDLQTLRIPAAFKEYLTIPELD